MTLVLWLLIVQGAMGAFDTLYYHEWRARLPAGDGLKRRELALHAPRSLVYSLLFASLPWIAWSGWCAALLGALLLVEIVITLLDFAVEDDVRAPLGGVFRGERITHALMGIVYGAMLGALVPEMIEWSRAPTGFVRNAVDVPLAAKLLLTAMGGGVLLSGVRDLLAALGRRGSAWPWA